MSDGEIVVKLTMEDGGYKVAVVNAGRLMREFKQSLDSTATSIKKVEEHQFSLGRKFRDLVMTMGALRFVAMDVNDIFLRLPMAILKTAGELERMQVLMKGLSKELTEAGRAAEGLRDFQFVTNMAKNAPFEIGALSDSFVKLKVAGIDPTNGSMKALVDSVARFGGTGESLKRASVAIQQMAGKGVVSMEELRQQLGEAVPTAMQDMADGLGMSMQELAKVVQTGTLQAGPAIAKMLIQMRINNEGAAAEMMSTWVGTTARFKTEMQLAAKSIADAGFAEEAKKVVRELTEALQSPEFARFGADSGKALGDLVRGLTDVTKMLISYRGEIELLVKAWLVYKGLNLVAGVAEFLKGQGQKVIALRDEAVRIAEVSQIKRAENLRMAASEAQRTQRELAEHSRRSAMLRAELAEVQAHNAAVIAADARMRAQLAVQGGVTIPGLSRIRSRERGAEEIAGLAQQNSMMIARERELAREIAVTSAAMDASKVAAAQKAAALGTLAGASRLAAMASTGAAVAAKGLGAAIGFLGGPIGVTITAVMALVWWFQRAGAAADEAKARMDRATNNQGTKEDLKALTDELREAEQKLNEAKKNQERGREYRERNGGSSIAQQQTNRKAAEAEERAVLAAEKRVNELRKAVGETRLTVIEEGGRAQAERIQTAVGRVINKLEEGARLEIRSIEKRQAEVLGAMKKGTKEYQDKVNEFNNEKQQALVKGIAQRARALSAAAVRAEDDALKNAEGSSERAGGMTAAKKMRQDAEQLQAELNQISEDLASKAGFTPKKDKPSKSTEGKDSPIQKFLEDLRERRAQLEAELEGFEDTEAKSDKATGIYERIMQRWQNGDFADKKTGKNIGFMEADSAAREAQEEVLLKQRIKDRQDVAEKARAFADFVKGMEPEYLDAIELLQDPLGKSKMGRSEKQVFKLLGGMSEEELTAAAQRMGTTVDRVKTELVNKAQTIDSVSFFQNIEQETKQLNESLVDDSREAAVKRMAADNERHAQEMRNIYEKRQASGEASGEELLRLQNAINANMSARAAKLAMEARSPLEKLGSEWKNVARNMEDASVQWANSTMNAITQLVMTGKADFRSLANSIIADIIRINLQKAASSALSSIGGMIMGALVPGSTPSASTSTYSLTTAPNYSGGGLGFKFADGGIMTEFGSLPLRKYANGGIARSPQLAMFGEGSMPEAYVPLPDGRSIPVTMKGGAGDSVTINITINKDGGESESAEGDDPQMYRRLSERIKGVVREELAAQKRPGGILYT